MCKKIKNLNGKIIVKLLMRNAESQRYEISEQPLLANRDNAKLQFFLDLDQKQYYLFEQSFSKGVYRYFKQGVRLSQLRKYNNWNKNMRLDKTIEDRIPQCTKYVIKELAYGIAN